MSSTANTSGPEAADLAEFDLAVLAYHIYNQSLLWPLDPWYEEWSRIGSNRRDNVMAAAHAWAADAHDYRGPGSTRGWPTNYRLDPVLADYRQVHPWDGCVTYDGIVHRYFSADPVLIGAVRDVVVCEYADVATKAGDPFFSSRITNPKAAVGATDQLYTFEGETGSVDGQPGAWSLIGIVHDRELDSGDYEVHIAYRGSQSGSAYRAAFEGFVLEAGNPDWVTDMELRKMVADPAISPIGEVVTGLRDSVVSSFATLTHCLADIAERRARPPRAVHISGHSLGAALATQAASALVVGGFQSSLSEQLREWPWAELSLRTFASPKVGDQDFADHFDANVSCRRIWADGDPIIDFPLNSHVGVPIELQTATEGTLTHEPYIVRRAMNDSMHWQGRAQERVSVHEPWRAFPDLAQALLAAENNGDSIAALFGSWSATDDAMVAIAAKAVQSPSSYRMPFTKLRAELRRRRRRLESVFSSNVETTSALRAKLRGLRGVQPGSGAENHLRRMLIIKHAARLDWAASDLLEDVAIARAFGSHRHPKQAAADAHRDVALPAGPPPNRRDEARVRAVIWMRTRHFATVNNSTVKSFRRRVPPTSGMPHLVRACRQYPGLEWLPKELMVPKKMPNEALLPKSYVAKYYGLGKVGWGAYAKSPIRPEVPWNPSYEWNRAFPPTGDGWEHPTSDETFVRLRTQGPNPFMLRQVGDHYELDFSEILADVVPPIVARFDLVDGALVPRDISIATVTHKPGDPTWGRAKRVVNAADVRCIPFGRHLLDTHFVVGQGFALAAYSLPTWHPLRPFMHFFSYGTMQVNDYAFQAFFEPSSYFLASGFMSIDDAERLFKNRLANFDFDEWIVPRDIANRGLDRIDDHPYVQDALEIWPEFVAVVERHLDDLGFDDQAIRKDNDLQAWFFTLAKLLPNTDTESQPLGRARLVELCAAFLYNNVVHEICGDMSPILGSVDHADKAIVNFERLKAAIGNGQLTTPLAAPSMADVFLMDQASYSSRFNVGGNKIIDINAARWVDDPKLCDAIVDLQETLHRLDAALVVRNHDRVVRFGRMLPRNWEASVSF